MLKFKRIYRLGCFPRVQLINCFHYWFITFYNPKTIKNCEESTFITIGLHVSVKSLKTDVIACDNGLISYLGKDIINLGLIGFHEI